MGFSLTPTLLGTHWGTTTEKNYDEFQELSVIISRLKTVEVFHDKISGINFDVCNFASSNGHAPLIIPVLVAVVSKHKALTRCFRPQCSNSWSTTVRQFQKPTLDSRIQWIHEHGCVLKSSHVNFNINVWYKLTIYLAHNASYEAQKYGKTTVSAFFKLLQQPLNIL